MTWYAPNLTSSHRFFGSKGGFSTGVFAGLNISPKGNENPQEFEQNLAYVATQFGLDSSHLMMLNQGVSNVAHYVSAPSQYQLDGDGLVTDKNDIILCLRTADCAPILLEDTKNHIIGAAHAGWRGAFFGIIENVIDLMLQKGAELDHISAAIGPCIAQKSYEVDDNFYQTFISANTDYAKYFALSSTNNHYLFDLESFCYDKLQSCGIKDISASHLDTYELEEDYYSYRRFTHRHQVLNNGGFAAQMSAIVMRS